jgi:hypothetical protein
MAEWRIEAASVPPRWWGDLNDDCTAFWAGFTLRAEWTQRDLWWWCVYDSKSGAELISSNHSSESFTSGPAARGAAESAARRFLGLPDS